MPYNSVECPYSMNSSFQRCIVYVCAGGLVALLVYLLVSTQYPMFFPEEKGRVQVVPTQHQDFIIATGTVESRNDVVLAFEEGGVVREVLYDAGDVVHAGSVIVSLNAETLRSEVETQRSRLDRETVRLNEFVDGPEDAERARVEAGTAVSERSLESAVRNALVLAQQSAVVLENRVHTELDVFFDGTIHDPNFSGNVSALEKQEINKIRRDAESIFSRWRSWSGIDSGDHRRVTKILNQFRDDLRELYDGTAAMYDLLLPLRSLRQENLTAFSLLAKLRADIFDSIVVVIKHTNMIHAARAQYNLALAQSAESLTGGTRADRSAQSAQVAVERERLRRLDLQLAKTLIRAPFDGVVGEVFTDVGSFVTRGTGAVRFVSRDGFDLTVDVTEVEVQNITSGQEMRAVVEVTGEEMDVRVRTVDATEKRVTDVPVYTVVFDIITDGVQIRSGMTVDVYVPYGDPIDVFAVPRPAIMKDDSREYVLVERGGDVMVVPVTIGASVDDETIVVTGELYEDDIVILEADAHEQE